MKAAVVKIIFACILAIMLSGFSAAQEEGSGVASVLSRYKVNLYGKIQLDAIFHDSNGYPGPYLLYGISERLDHDDNHFYMTANSTRLGLSFQGPEDNGRSLSGLIEADFQGNPQSGDPDLLLRHAYLTYKFGNGFELLAGQAWDVISPLQPFLLNWAPAWGWGNIGFWHPQLRISYKKGILEMALAASEPREGDLDGKGWDDGQDSGYPNFQGRIGFRFSDKFAFGFSGHYGEEEIDYTDVGERYINTWSGNFDLMFPISNIMTVTGEFFVGQNLDGFMGGVLQGIHIYTDTHGHVVREGLWAMGGWIAFALSGRLWKLNTGGSLDDVHDYRLSPGSGARDDFGDRTQNMVFWLNVLYDVYKDLQVGFEFSHTETLYYRAKKGEPNRYQLAVIYNF